MSRQQRSDYAQYLFPVQVNSEKSYPFPIEDEGENSTKHDMEDIVYEREDELRLRSV